MIRLTTIEDISKLAEIERSAARKFALHLGIEIPDSQTVAHEILVKAQALGLLWLAEKGSNIVGFLVGRKVDGCLHIEEISVAYDYQGNGIGKALVDAAVLYCHQNQVGGISLTTDKNIPWNGPYYSKLGFHEVALEQCLPELKSILEIDRAKNPDSQNRIAMILKF